MSISEELVKAAERAFKHKQCIWSSPQVLPDTNKPEEEDPFCVVYDNCWRVLGGDSHNFPDFGDRASWFLLLCAEALRD